MDCLQHQSLMRSLHQRALSKIARENEKQTRVLTLFQDKYKKVLEALRTIPLDFTVNCMIPIGQQALMEGKLTHTNEILVCLGGRYFVNYTATQAIELCSRRIKSIEERLMVLEKKECLLKSRQDFSLSNVSFGDTSKELIEYWEDEHLENWRSQHRQNEREYHGKKSEGKQEIDFLATDEDLFCRLDELELGEELADEYYRFCENGESYEDEREDEEVKEEKKGEVNCGDKNFKDSSERETFNVSESALTNAKNAAESSYNNNRTMISFNHTNVLPQYNDSDGQMIYSPGDIYNISYNPESISGRCSQNNFHYVENITSFKKNTFLEAYDSINSGSSICLGSIIKDVQEKILEDKKDEPGSSIKPISKFKVERENLHKGLNHT